MPNFYLRNGYLKRKLVPVPYFYFQYQSGITHSDFSCMLLYTGESNPSQYNAIRMLLDITVCRMHFLKRSQPLNHLTLQFCWPFTLMKFALESYGHIPSHNSNQILSSPKVGH